MTRAEFEAAVGPISTREEFLEELRTAIDEGTGYATGKLGRSDQSWLRYPEVLSREPPGTRRRAFEVVLAYKSLPTTGIFPAEPEFLRRWSSYYVERVKRLDAVLGLGGIVGLWSLAPFRRGGRRRLGLRRRGSFQAPNAQAAQAQCRAQDGRAQRHKAAA